MSIIYICITGLISSVIIAISIYKSIKQLSLSINNLSTSIQFKRVNNAQHYTIEKIEKKDNTDNIYEKNIIESTVNAQSQVFSRPAIASGGTIQSNAQDDDLNDISEQLKGMKT